MNDIYKQNLHNLKQAAARYLDPDVPNETPSDDILTCDFCGEVIRNGEPHLSFNDTFICDNCLEDMNAKLLMEVLKIEMEV